MLCNHCSQGMDNIFSNDTIHVMLKISKTPNLLSHVSKMVFTQFFLVRNGGLLREYAHIMVQYKQRKKPS